MKGIFMEDEELKKAREDGKREYDSLAEAVKKEAVSIDPEEEAKIKAFMERANMPIELKDEDVQLGAREIDVRGLSPKAYKQLSYKFSAMQTALLHDMAQSLVDVQRLLLLTLKHMGVEDVAKELTDLCMELSKDAKEASKGEKA